MCGIAGIVRNEDPNVLRDRLHAMTDAIAHRGPDDNGHYISSSVALGMRRLSIIDLAGGQQPIVADNGVVIVFNGEIYNYRALRNSLKKEGAVFKTHSDTEVILQLYLKDGIGCVEKLQGMFAIALYDPRVKTLHLVRDRLGIKPLYYCTGGDGLVFGSELKALLKGLTHQPSVNGQAMADYLTFRFVPAPQTMWDGVFKLLPGHRLEYDLEERRCRSVRYWDCAIDSQPLDSARDYPKEFEALFMEAVQARIVAADVPVGVLLSGGLDSSSVAAAVAELGHKNLNSYTVSFEEGGDFSEGVYAREMAEHFGLSHHEVTIDRAQFMASFEDFAYQTDEPLADLASIPLWHVCQRARQDVAVVLAGEGADEMLAGYHLDRAAAWLYKMKRLGGAVPPIFLRGAAFAAQAAGRGRGLHMLALHGWSDLYKHLTPHSTSVWDDGEKTALVKSSFIPAQEVLDRWYANCSGAHPLDHLMEVQRRQWLVEDLLMKADKMSMAVSLELRVPFLDHRMVEWAARLPMEWKVGTAVSGWTTKRVLRAFAASRVPESILNRPKQGFPVPCYQWLRDSMFRKHVSERFLRSGSPLGDFLHMTPVFNALERAGGGDMKAAHKVWTVLVLDHWMERWL